MLLLKIDHVVRKLDGCEHKVELATAGLALLANKELAAMPSMPVSLLEPAIDRQVEQSLLSLEAWLAPMSAAATKPTAQQSNVAELTAMIEARLPARMDNYEAPVTVKAKSEAPSAAEKKYEPHEPPLHTARTDTAPQSAAVRAKPPIALEANKEVPC